MKLCERSANRSVQFNEDNPDMRKLLNTLYVTTPESFLHKDGENVIIKVGNEERFRIPIHNLESIVCFGYMGASPSLMRLCSDNNVGLSFLTPHGKFLGRVSGKVRGNVLLRRTQYRVADNLDASLNLAKCFMLGGKSSTAGQC